MARRTSPAILVALAIAAFLGCARQSAKESERRGFTDYAQLTAVSESGNRLLTDEIARLRAERATPLLLHEDLQAEISDERRKAIDAWAGVFNEDELMRLHEELRVVLPSGVSTVTAGKRHELVAFDQRYQKQRKALREIVSWRSSPIEIDHTLGLAEEAVSVTVAEKYHALETLHAALLVDEGHPAAAVEPLRYSLEAARLLAREKHVVPRLMAVDLRDQSSQLMKRITVHPQTDRAVLAELQEIVDDQLASWTPDSHAWIGDRALGLHIYEMVRAGDTLSILTDSEREELRGEGSLYTLANLVQGGCDADQLYYLESMRQIIDASRQPYHRRKALFAEITGHLHEIRGEPDFPFVAGRILLPAVKDAHRLQAIDRARMEAWSLALSAALDETIPANIDNSPVTGKPYRVTMHDGEVRVARLADLGDDETIRVVGQASSLP